MLTRILVLVKAYEALFPVIRWFFRLMYDLCEEHIQRESHAHKAEGGASF